MRLARCRPAANVAWNRQRTLKPMEAAVRYLDYFPKANSCHLGAAILSRMAGCSTVVWYRVSPCVRAFCRMRLGIQDCEELTVYRIAASWKEMTMSGLCVISGGLRYG